MSLKHRPKFLLPSLQSGPLPLESLRSHARKSLLEAIDARRGSKTLVLDSAISGHLSYLDSSLHDLLTEHGVTTMLRLESSASTSIAESASVSGGGGGLIRNIIFLARPTVGNAELVASIIKSSRSSSSLEFSVLFVPRRSIVVDRVLEDEGVVGDLISIGELPPLEIIPVEDDVMSLELPHSFKDCVADGDSGSLFLAARSIMRLQSIFGLIPRVQGKGPAAIAVRDMFIRMRRETPYSHSSSTTSSSAPLISRMVMIDREVDLVTPMMTQISFEGLIDEVTGIKNGTVSWVPSKEAPPSSSSNTSSAANGAMTAALNSASDPFFKEFRDLPFHIAIQKLQNYARDARREYADLGSKDISDLKTYVKGLPKLPLLERLTDIAIPLAERVKQQIFHDRLRHEQDIVEGYDTDASVAFIEELIYRGESLLSVLRLIVLLNECHQGLSKKHLDSLRNEVLLTFGHEHLLTFSALERAGLLRLASPTGKASFAQMRKAMRLIVEDGGDEKQSQPPISSGQPQEPSGASLFKPTDISHLYKGYAPLSIRLVEQALRPSGWQGISPETLSVLPGAHFDILQGIDDQGLPTEKPYKASAVSSSVNEAGEESSSSQPEVVLVVFLGGVTFSEISALRFLSSLPGNRHRFIVLTTSIVNGTTLLRSFVDPVAEKLNR